MNLDDLVTCSSNEDLELTSFVERTIQQSKQALMGYIGSVFGWVLVQLIRYVEKVAYDLLGRIKDLKSQGEKENNIDKE